ncbi:MAG TPA: putative metal-dependent hydrolase [Terracidiphilus sp.]|nr:putative metal-dependent hydrolase [Terracidiphilus sp.]
MTSLDELRYPVGRFDSATAGSRADQLEVLRQLPGRLRHAVSGLDDAQLDTPYREGGWTVRQVVHHFADSHANSYIRVKLALTEDTPVIKPYDEAAWANLPDSRMPVEVSLPFVEAVHARFVALYEFMSEAEYGRTYVHPERGAVTLAQNLAIYAWHCRHHLAHITRLREEMGW